MELETYVEGTEVVTRAICTTPYTVGSMVEGSLELTVRDPVFVIGDDLVVRDAGALGGHLYATVTAVSGNTVTLDAPAAAEVRRVPVGKLANPGTATFTARRSDEAPTAYVLGTDAEVQNPSTGVFELRLVNDERDWLVHFQGTTPCHCAGEVAYRIKRSRALA